MITVFSENPPSIIFKLAGALVIFTTLVSEIFILSSVWHSNMGIKVRGIKTETLDEIKTNLGLILLFFFISFLPFAHLLFSPLSISRCVAVIEASQDEPYLQQYSSLAKNFAMASLALFTIYTGAIVMVITFAGVGAL